MDCNNQECFDCKYDTLVGLTAGCWDVEEHECDRCPRFNKCKYCCSEYCEKSKYYKPKGQR